MGGEILQRLLKRKRLFSGKGGALLAILILAVAAVLAAYLEPGAPPVGGSARASDGDSFRIGEHRIRLLGIDAPELRQTCLDNEGQSWPCGIAARNRMAQLLAQGEVQCQPEGTDRYQRLLAYCTAGKDDLGARLVGEGLAIAAGRYEYEEQRAREAKLGIWQGGFETPRSWRQDHTGTVFGWRLLSIFGL
jgi:endonuclease YncB( thermonuclease family)